MTDEYPDRIDFGAGYRVITGPNGEIAAVIDIACRSIGKDGVAHILATGQYSVDDAVQLARDIIDVAKAAHLGARIQAGDPKAIAEAQEEADRRDREQNGPNSRN
jgi:hypothetical protein